MKKASESSERGSAGAKMLIVLAVLALIGNAGFNYIPVAYEGESFKQDMQTAVVQGMAVPAGVTPTEMVKARINKAMAADGIPPNAFVQVKPTANSVQARVAYSRQVHILPFGLYTYNYVFDHTATPTGFLLKN